MNKITSVSLIVLSTLAASIAAAGPPVNIDLGIVSSPKGSASSCQVTQFLPTNENQVSTISHSGQVTFDPHASTFTDASGQVNICVGVSWNLSAIGAFSGSEAITFQDRKSATIHVTGILNPVGAILPKYQILGVDYAPPGISSSVTYSSDFMRGGSTSNAETFSDQTDVTVSQSGEFNIGALRAKSSTTVTSSYAQVVDRQGGNSWSFQSQEGVTVNGPAASVVGIDHDYDIVWIWLNPAVNLTMTGPSSVTWQGYSSNPADPANEMDVTFLYVYELKDPSTIPTNVASRLARTWDPVLGGLTTADYASILTADPFATNPSYDPNTDTSGRYTLEAGQTFNYLPAAPGAQPITQTFTSTAQTTTTASQSVQDTHSVASSVDNSLGGTLFSVTLGVETKTTNTYTSTTKLSTTNTSMTGQTATLSITGPLASDNYTGPTAIQIWRDNVYGSYTFFGVE